MGKFTVLKVEFSTGIVLAEDGSHALSPSGQMLQKYGVEFSMLEEALAYARREASSTVDCMIYEGGRYLRTIEPDDSKKG